MSIIAVGFIGAFIWAMIRITKPPSIFSDVCIKVLDSTESSMSLKADFDIIWSMAYSDEEKNGILCQHIKSNEAFAGKFNRKILFMAFYFSWKPSNYHQRRFQYCFDIQIWHIFFWFFPKLCFELHAADK